MCFFKHPVCENDLPQDPHMLTFRPPWVVLTWVFRLVLARKNLLQTLQLYFFSLLA